MYYMIIISNIAKINTNKDDTVNCFLMATLLLRIFSNKIVFCFRYVMWYPNFAFTESRVMNTFWEISCHFLPAFLYDLLLRAQGRKAMYVFILILKPFKLEKQDVSQNVYILCYYI